MGKLETLTIDLPEQLAADLRRAVERGEYDSVADAVTAAVEDLLYAPPWYDDPGQTERLRRLVHEGIDSGPARHTSVDELLAEARRRHALRMSPKQ